MTVTVLAAVLLLVACGGGGDRGAEDEASPATTATGEAPSPVTSTGGNHDVYVYDLEMGTETRLTEQPGLDIEPNWSPDGEWIVFGSDRDKQGTRDPDHPVCCVDIFMIRKDGSDVRQVTDHPAKDSEPVWAAPGGGEEPSGRIVFLSWRTGDREIFSINVDGSDPKNLTNDPGVDENPDVSPDGKRIVWTSDRDGGRLHLYVMDIDGSNVRQLTFDPGGDNSPRWSPDGREIAFARGSSIMVVDAEGGEPEVLFQGGDPTEDPLCQAGGFPGGWSPDGGEIAYYSADATRGISQVCTVDVDGSNATAVIQSPGFHAEPTWSRDGRYLAFRSIR